jgi:hypothetical protein
MHAKEWQQFLKKSAFFVPSYLSAHRNLELGRTSMLAMVQQYVGEYTL